MGLVGRDKRCRRGCRRKKRAALAICGRDKRRRSSRPAGAVSCRRRLGKPGRRGFRSRERIGGRSGDLCRRNRWPLRFWRGRWDLLYTPRRNRRRRRRDCVVPACGSTTLLIGTSRSFRSWSSDPMGFRYCSVPLRPALELSRFGVGAQMEPISDVLFGPRSVRDDVLGAPIADIPFGSTRRPCTRRIPSRCLHAGNGRCRAPRSDEGTRRRRGGIGCTSIVGCQVELHELT